MYHKHHTKGIVVYGMNEGDDSKRIWIFSEDFGLLGAKAQGSRKSGSRLKFGLQDFSYGTFSLIKGKTGWKLVSVNTENNFFEDLKFSKVRASIAVNVLNFVHKNIGIEEENKELFKIVFDFLKFLKITEDSKVSLAECLVMLRVIHNLGFLKHDPEFSNYLAFSVLDEKELELVAPRKAQMINLINDSMKSTDFFV